MNHAFKGILIPAAGNYRVEFAYRPRRFNLTLTLSFIGFGLLGVSVWKMRK
jgi:hypothetical protein